MDHIPTDTQFPEALFLTDLVFLEGELRGGFKFRITRATDRAFFVALMQTGESKSIFTLASFQLRELETKDGRAAALSHIRQACAQAGALKKSAMLQPGE